MWSLGVCGILILITMYWYKKRKFRKPGDNVAMMAVLGSGGHTGEMIKIINNMNFERYSPRLYIIADTDTISQRKVEALEADSSEFRVQAIPRAREVHQGWISTIISTMKALVKSFQIVASFKPDLLLCNGPGSCVPICFCAFLLNNLWWCKARIVYVESVCRVETMSLSGKILYYICDDFFVQWNSLMELYPKAKYIGRLV